MKTKSKTNKGIKEVYNLIILDRSGSMETIAQQAIAGVNETIGTIKAAIRSTGIDQRVTLTSFCGCSVIEHYSLANPKDIKPLTSKDYEPCCSTPLYDTMGNALTKLRKALSGRNDVAVSVTIITDGYENASRQWTAPQIKALVELLKADGWLFAFIGANQDMDQIKISLSIENTMAFKNTPEETEAMFCRERNARMNWNHRLAKCEAVPDIDNSNYFEQ